MILKNNLYKVLNVDSDARSFSLELIEECPIYRAHFPERPITPGVCIIQIAAELIASLLQQDLLLSDVSNAKFLAVIDPSATKRISVSFDKISPGGDDLSIKTQIRVHNDETLFSKLSLTFIKK
ncbi:MAG: beta-hydroxyacyl-ACP dehydratase [Lepagella sp.]